MLRRRAALLEAANTARDAKAFRDKEAEAYFSEGKQHNTAGDFWAARQYFEHAYVAAPRNAFLLSVANMQVKLHEPESAAEIYKQMLEQEAGSTEREIEMAR